MADPPFLEHLAKQIQVLAHGRSLLSWAQSLGPPSDILTVVRLTRERG
jgi:hypothetical protein